MEDNIQKQLQDAQLRILKEIDRVCAENGLTYWLAFGTILGAVRHHGFIPWDDDIDLFMPVKDAEKLEALQDRFPPNLFVQSRRTEPEHGLMITRVRDSNTTLIEEAEADRDINHGIFVDIYPVYNAPAGRFGQKVFLARTLIARLLEYGRVPQTHGTVMKAGSGVLLALVPKRARKRIVDRLYRKIAGQPDSGLLACAWAEYTRNVFPKDWFFPPERLPFEDMQAPVPGAYDKLLTIAYGDYMQLPPAEKRTVHHAFRVLDFERPYTVYRGKEYACKKQPAAQKGQV